MNKESSSPSQEIMQSFATFLHSCPVPVFRVHSSAICIWLCIHLQSIPFPISDLSLFFFHWLHLTFVNHFFFFLPISATNICLPLMLLFILLGKKSITYRLTSPLPPILNQRRGLRTSTQLLERNVCKSHHFSM